MVAQFVVRGKKIDGGKIGGKGRKSMGGEVGGRKERWESKTSRGEKTQIGGKGKRTRDPTSTDPLLI